MSKYLGGLFFLICLFAVSSAAQTDPPKLTPVPSTDAQKALIAQGTNLHDQQNYDGAIAKYQQVLQENPDDVEAMYEMTFSLYAKKDYQGSLTAARKGVQYKSDLLAAFFMEIGNAQDELGDPKGALVTYKAAISDLPGHYLLYYNLGVTQRKLNQLDDAKASAKQAAYLKPEHPGSQLLLSQLFDRGGYRIPALLAACRFLILEPRSDRAEGARQSVQELMQRGVTPEVTPHISILPLMGTPRRTKAISTRPT